MKITETLVRSALAAPALFADDLVAITNDRGARDVAIVLAARSGDWDRLRTAAAIAGRTAADSGANMAGPLVTFGVAAWAAGEMDEELLALIASVPASDPARKMAALLVALVMNNVPASAWISRMAAQDIAACLAFSVAGRSAA